MLSVPNVCFPNVKTWLEHEFCFEYFQNKNENKGNVSLGENGPNVRIRILFVRVCVHIMHMCVWVVCHMWVCVDYHSLAGPNKVLQFQHSCKHFHIVPTCPNMPNMGSMVIMMGR